MLNVNQVNLAGNLTRTPELRFTNEGTAVCEFGIAINDRVSNKTTFVDVVVWGKAAEACQKYLGKGSAAFIAGRLQFDQWEKAGKKSSRLRVVAENVQFLGKAPAAKVEETPAPEAKKPAKVKKAPAKKAKKTSAAKAKK